MAKYKITKTDEYYTYELPAHNECKLTRLHDPADVEGGKLILSRSHFLPAGGGTTPHRIPCGPVNSRWSAGRWRAAPAERPLPPYGCGQ